MEFGSVKFFRRVISLTVLVIIVALIVAICITGVSRSNLKEKLTSAQDQLTEAQQQLDGTKVSRIKTDDLPYQEMYPEMYAEPAEEYTVANKTVYLTFDDGPSAVTERILDVLDRYGVKATFFTQGQADENNLKIMKRAAEEGHAIGVHTYTHDYLTIFANPEAFFSDFNLEYQQIYETTGVRPEICRFPGGTVNKYSELCRTQICAELLRRGFSYYDWNATAVSSSRGSSVDDIVKNGIDTGADRNRIIMLLHDSAHETNTPQAVEELIEYYQGKGYSFAKLTNDVQPITFD
ncbi:MAG: polysaccharide deacetylase [Clostridia bacterium]|nr:polysaccharide deacetylase [Clostridia bacterium]